MLKSRGANFSCYYPAHTLSRCAYIILLGWAKFRQLCCPTILHALLLLLASWAIKEACNPNSPNFPAKITSATIYKRPSFKIKLYTLGGETEDKELDVRVLSWSLGSGGALRAPKLYVLEMLSHLKSLHVIEFWGFGVLEVWELWGFRVLGFLSCGVFEFWGFWVFGIWRLPPDMEAAAHWNSSSPL